VNFRQIFCNHEWKKQSEAILPSAFEQAMRTGEYTINPAALTGQKDSWFFKKKLIFTFICKKCNKIKTFVEENP